MFASLSMNLRGRIDVPPVQHLRTPRLGETGETRCPTWFMFPTRAKKLSRLSMDRSAGLRPGNIPVRISSGGMRP